MPQADLVPTADQSADIRSTGVGWAMGLGRLGAIVGPLAIGLLVSRG